MNNAVWFGLANAVQADEAGGAAVTAAIAARCFESCMSLVRHGDDCEPASAHHVMLLIRQLLIFGPPPALERGIAVRAPRLPGPGVATI